MTIIGLLPFCGDLTKYFFLSCKQTKTRALIKTILHEAYHSVTQQENTIWDLVMTIQGILDYFYARVLDMYGEVSLPNQSSSLKLTK